MLVAEWLVLCAYRYSPYSYARVTSVNIYNFQGSYESIEIMFVIGNIFFYWITCKNNTIKNVDVIHWLVFISLRSVMLHFLTKFSPCSGAVLALKGITILPATEKTHSLLLKAARKQKMILTISTIFCCDLLIS